MRCSLQTLLRSGVLVALLLPPGRVAAEDPQEAQSPPPATEQAPAVPELAEVIPLATRLSAGLADLARTASDQSELSRLEQQVREAGTRVDEDARRFERLQTSADRRAGELPELRHEIESVSDALSQIGDAIAASVRTFATLRMEWIAKRRQWDAWQAALREDEPLEEITASVAEAEEEIHTALSLLRTRLERLLTLQQQVGALQAKVGTLGADVEARLSLAQGRADLNASPPMFSRSYLAQLRTLLGAGARNGWVQISWPEGSFFAEQGWILVLQGMLSLGLALLFFRHRGQLEHVEHWRFIATRPIAAGILVGVMSMVTFFQRPPAMVLLVLSVLIGIAFVRLVGALVEGGWRLRFVYGLVGLLVLTNACYVLGLPFAVFRLYLVAAALPSLLCCIRWGGESRRLKEPRLYAWALRSAAVLFAAVLFTELRGEAKVAEFLFVSSLRTLAVVLAFALFRRVVNGALEWAVERSAARGLPMVRDNVTAVVGRLSLLFDLLIGVVVIGVLLVVWRVYEGPAEAIAGLLSVRTAIGSQGLTLGLVLLAVAALGVSYAVSWVLQTLLTQSVLIRRSLDPGVTISITRLLHYALVSIGCVIALVVLGVDLTKMTLLASALGVGIGFGLQTIVNNFVCGLILLLERPVRVGDTIEMGGEWVRIAKIGLRSTTVRTLDQADVIVPNTDLVTNQVTNWTLTDRHARITIPVGVAYGSNVDLVIRTLKGCALAQPEVLKSPEPEILFQNFGDSSLNFELRVWVRDVDRRLQVASDLNRDIDHRFHEAAIEIPFPQRDLHIRSGAKGNEGEGLVAGAPST